MIKIFNKQGIYLFIYLFFYLLIFYIFYLSTWMILDEFTNVMNFFIEKDFPVRDIPIIYISSMRIQVSELISDRHYNMLFPEFLEAFCRVIDKSSPIPKNETIVIFNFFSKY